MRTDPKAKKHEGISFILFDMTTPGVEVKPIKLISGASPFCETFFEDVKVPKHQLVGELNKGWTIAKYLLTHEREMIGGNSTVTRPLYEIAAGGLWGLLRANSLIPCCGPKLPKPEVDEWAFNQTMVRKLAEAKGGRESGG